MLLCQLYWKNGPTRHTIPAPSTSMNANRYQLYGDELAISHFDS